MGEEWRRGWHPEVITAKGSDARVLIVGAGAAGLEAARALGARGYAVMLAEASREIGGRITREAALPGMSEYIRVRDYRAQQLIEMPNVEIFRESLMTAQDVMAVDAAHVAIATGAKWRKERFDEERYLPIATGEAAARVFTPDDIMDGTLPDGPTLVFDGDEYYMGGVIAERIRAEGNKVTYVTVTDSVSSWAGNTAERRRIRAHLMRLGIGVETAQVLSAFDGRHALLHCAYTDAERTLAVHNIVMVTARRPNDGLYRTLRDGSETLPFSLTRIGDCDAPAIIAAAVYAGHRYAQELECEVDIDLPLRHDRIDVGLDARAQGAGWQSAAE
jgi:dimethylamine/trimethylamine dehydrogenase